MKNRKIIISILFYLIGIIVLMNCIKIALEEQTYLKVNEDNKQSIREALSEVLKSDDEIVKVSIGNGFHSGEFHIYYKSGEEQKFIIGSSKIGKIDNNYIDSYVRENGYDYDNIAVSIGIIVAILMITVTIIKVVVFIKRKKVTTNNKL